MGENAQFQKQTFNYVVLILVKMHVFIVNLGFVYYESDDTILFKHSNIIKKC